VAAGDRDDPFRGLVFVTSNPGKAREAALLLGHAVEALAADLREVQSLSFEEVVRAKAAAAAGLLGVPVLVEDSGLEIRAWGGFPGPLTKWITMGPLGHAGLARMLDAFEDRGAAAVSALAIARPSRGESDVIVAIGRREGSIARAPRGTRGFGWDVVFVPEGETCTFAEMTDEEKNRDSHRARAFAALRARLAGEATRPPGGR
jgi:XTP/dITP diphosphohydrolase